LSIIPEEPAFAVVGPDILAPAQNSPETLNHYAASP
jgi:hypothetical protein